jgi:CPA2 family monovalent cation:H+ antiporter-2
MQGLTGFLETATLLVCGAFALVTLCSRLGAPSISGYVLTGLLMGPTGLGLIAESGALNAIGEIGVILLLFTLGLEFSLEKLVSLRRLIFGVGAAQVLLTTIFVAGIADVFTGLHLIPSILVGGAVSMSSTALCLKVLTKAGSLGSPHGRIAIAILLFQDLGAVAFLLFQDAVTGSHGHGLLAFFGGAGALVAALFAARGPLQWLARWIADCDDSELAQLLALAVALGAAIAAVSVKLSPAIAAFAVGMTISEGDARHVVEREIRPFRDLFVGIFFIGIGTQLQLSTLASVWPTVLIWLCALIIGKSLIVTAILYLFGEQVGTAFRTGAILAHGGEFGLVLLSASMASGFITSGIGGPLFLALGISMLGASFLVKWAGTE